jgi:hypothetical protein
MSRFQRYFFAFTWEQAMTILENAINYYNKEFRKCKILVILNWYFYAESTAFPQLAFHKHLPMVQLNDRFDDG